MKSKNYHKNILISTYKITNTKTSQDKEDGITHAQKYKTIQIMCRHYLISPMYNIYNICKSLNMPQLK